MNSSQFVSNSSHASICIATKRRRSLTEELMEAGLILPDHPPQIFGRTLSSSTATSINSLEGRPRSLTEGLMEAGCILPNLTLSTLVCTMPSPTSPPISVVSTRTNYENPYRQLGPQIIPILRHESDESFADKFFERKEALASTTQTAEDAASPLNPPFAKRICLSQEEPLLATTEKNLFSNNPPLLELSRTRSNESDSSHRSYFSDLSYISLDLHDIFHGKGKHL